MIKYLSSGQAESADEQQVSFVMLLLKEWEGLIVENRGLKERIQLDALVQQAVIAHQRPFSASDIPNDKANANRALEQEIGLLSDK
jgi:hypothetical protein